MTQGNPYTRKCRIIYGNMLEVLHQSLFAMTFTYEFDAKLDESDGIVEFSQARQDAIYMISNMLYTLETDMEA